MTRVFGHFVALEMFGLWLVEFVPCLLALYLLLIPAGVWTDVVSLQHATMLALGVSATWVLIGLYQPEVCLQNWRLLVSTATGGVLALPVLWLTGLLTLGGFIATQIVAFVLAMLAGTPAVSFIAAIGATIIITRPAAGCPPSLSSEPQIGRASCRERG